MKTLHESVLKAQDGMQSVILRKKKGFCRFDAKVKKKICMGIYKDLQRLAFGLSF